LACSQLQASHDGLGRLVDAVYHLHAVGHRQAEIRAGLAGGVEPGHDLLQVHAHLVGQFSDPDQLKQGLALYLGDRGGPVLSRVHPGPDEVGAQGQPDPARRCCQCGQFGLGQPYRYFLLAPLALAGPTPSAHAGIMLHINLSTAVVPADV
jgi:hypothetical protein